MPIATMSIITTSTRLHGTARSLTVTSTRTVGYATTMNISPTFITGTGITTVERAKSP
jgi:hypothetical protein